MKTKTSKTIESKEATAIIGIDFEIVPAEVAVAITPLEKQSIEVGFFDYFKRAKEWADRARVITDPAEAKVLRKEGQGIRLEMNSQHKKLKEHSLLMGRAIDGAKNIGLAMIVPVEQALEEVEKAEEIRFAKSQAELRQRRLADLAPFMGAEEPEVINIEMLSERQFQNLLEDRKLLHATKLERARKEEEDRIAREKAEAELRAQQELELARLRKQQAQHQAELERIRAEEEEKNRKIREQQQELRRAEMEKIRHEAAEAFKKAEAERLEKEQILEKQREAEELELQKRLREEEARLAAEAAPDREKLKALSIELHNLVNKLNLSSKKGKVAEQEIKIHGAKFADWVLKKASSL